MKKYVFLILLLAPMLFAQNVPLYYATQDGSIPFAKGLIIQSLWANNLGNDIPGRFDNPPEACGIGTDGRFVLVHFMIKNTLKKPIRFGVPILKTEFGRRSWPASVTHWKSVGLFLHKSMQEPDNWYLTEFDTLLHPGITEFALIYDTRNPDQGVLTLQFQPMPLLGKTGIPIGKAKVVAEVRLNSEVAYDVSYDTAEESGWVGVQIFPVGFRLPNYAWEIKKDEEELLYLK